MNQEILPKAETSLRSGKPDPAFLVQTFLQGRSKATLRAYQKNLENFRDFVGAKSNEEVCAHLLSQTQGQANALVLSYRHELRTKGLAPATVNLSLAALRSLVKLGRMMGLCSFTLDVASLQAQPYRDTRGPGKAGVDNLLREISRRQDAKGIRDFALIKLMFDLAMRRSELVALDRKDIDLNGECLWLLGKGRLQQQRMTLAMETKDALVAWLRVRGEEAGPLFWNLDPGHPQQRLTDSGVYKMLRTLGRPHGLRHAAITEALEATNGNVRAVRQFSRHKSIEVVLLYDDQRKDAAGEITRLISKSRY
jgi:integrase/recombinase XerC